MKNYVQPGVALTVPAPDDVASGDGIVVGALFGVVQGDAVSGADCVIVTEGVFELPKVSGQAWTVGARVYWTSGGAATTAASGNAFIGVAAVAAANPSDTGVVRLNGAAAPA